MPLLDGYRPGKISRAQYYPHNLRANHDKKESDGERPKNNGPGGGFEMGFEFIHFSKRCSFGQSRKSGYSIGYADDIKRNGLQIEREVKN